MLPVHLVLEAKVQEAELVYMQWRDIVEIIVWITLMWPHWPGITFKPTA